MKPGQGLQTDMLVVVLMVAVVLLVVVMVVRVCVCKERAWSSEDHGLASARL